MRNLLDKCTLGEFVLIVPHDPQTEAIRSFNSYLASHHAVDTAAILPLRDGLTIVTLRR